MTNITTQNGTTKPMEARVKVLTAEVRTLMVGGRQVTLSVFNQLDWVDSWPGNFTPMGRVNHRDGEALVGVGPDGALVRARIPEVDNYLNLTLCRENGLARCETTLNYRTLKTLSYCEYKGHRFQVAGLANCLPPSDENYGSHWCETHRSAGEFDLDVGQVEDEKAHLEAMKALPLIVLAGLR